MEWGHKFEIVEADIHKLMASFLTSTFTSYPHDNCSKSSKLFFENLNKIIENIPIMILKRNKKEFFSKNEEIIGHLRKIMQIRIKDIDLSEPYSEFVRRLNEAIDNSQQNVEAMCISSFNKDTGEVDSDM